MGRKSAPVSGEPEGPPAGRWPASVLPQSRLQRRARWLRGRPLSRFLPAEECAAPPSPECLRPPACCPALGLVPLSPLASHTLAPPGRSVPACHHVGSSLLVRPHLRDTSRPRQAPGAVAPCPLRGPLGWLWAPRALPGSPRLLTRDPGFQLPPRCPGVRGAWGLRLGPGRGRGPRAPWPPGAHAAWPLRVGSVGAWRSFPVRGTATAVAPPGVHTHAHVRTFEPAVPPGSRGRLPVTQQARAPAVCVCALCWDGYDSFARLLICVNQTTCEESSSERGFAGSLASSVGDTRQGQPRRASLPLVPVVWAACLGWLPAGPPPPPSQPQEAVPQRCWRLSHSVPSPLSPSLPLPVRPWPRRTHTGAGLGLSAVQAERCLSPHGAAVQDLAL